MESVVLSRTGSLWVERHNVGWITDQITKQPKPLLKYQVKYLVIITLNQLRVLLLLYMSH